MNEPRPSVAVRATKKDRFGLSSRIGFASLIVVVLAGLGLQRMLSSPDKPTRADDRPASMKAVSTSEQSSVDAAMPTLAAPPLATPTSATTTPATPTNSLAASVPASIASHSTTPAAERAPATKLAAASPKAGAPAPKSGKVQFAIKPWGEIVVDGSKRGVSPPIKELSLPEGRHRIEIRNSTFSGYAGEVDVKAGQSVSIAHSFTSQ